MNKRLNFVKYRIEIDVLRVLFRKLDLEWKMDQGSKINKSMECDLDKKNA